LLPFLGLLDCCLSLFSLAWFFVACFLEFS